ncbi:lipase family protein, partial [Brucella sp. 21LCYQ03]|nr:lipase family protein [Brucella sp. 21LCYQ03]
PDSVVVAFRGSISFQEFYTYNCKSTYASLSFIDNSSVYVHAGAAAIYNLPVEGASTTVPTTLAEAIIAELKTIAPNKNVYLTGHDIGGAVASIAATDYALNDCGFQLKALYTFGSTLLSTISFKTLFDAHVGSKSYQLVRLQDKLHNAIQALGYFTIMNPITMNGQLEI